MAKRTRSGTPATLVLDRQGVAYTLHPYDHDPANRHFGAEAAEHLDVSPARVFKTLLVDCGPERVVAIVPVARSLDLKALATTVGAKRATLADPALAERVTGMLVGGISPVGQKQAHRTVADASMEDHPTVYVSAGRRGLQMELAPSDLIGLTGAIVASIARD